MLRKLINAGYRPGEVLFLDGINEQCDITEYQSELKVLFSKAQKSASYAWNISDIFGPVLIILRKALNKVRGSSVSDDVLKKHELECSLYGSSRMLSDILRQNLLERKSLCEINGLKCYTFVQPFAGVHGTHADFESLPKENRDILSKKFEHLKETWKSMDAIFLTDVLNGYKQHSFVDNVHYSFEANRIIANGIASKIY